MIIYKRTTTLKKSTGILEILLRLLKEQMRLPQRTEAMTTALDTGVTMDTKRILRQVRIPDMNNQLKRKFLFHKRCKENTDHVKYTDLAYVYILLELESS